jgi:hypothetical protein
LLLNNQKIEIMSIVFLSCKVHVKFQMRQLYWLNYDVMRVELPFNKEIKKQNYFKFKINLLDNFQYYSLFLALQFDFQFYVYLRLYAS